MARWYVDLNRNDDWRSAPIQAHNVAVIGGEFRRLGGSDLIADEANFNASDLSTSMKEKGKLKAKTFGKRAEQKVLRDCVMYLHP